MPNDEHQCIMHKEAQNHEFLGKKVIFLYHFSVGFNLHENRLSNSKLYKWRDFLRVRLPL